MGREYFKSEFKNVHDLLYQGITFLKTVQTSINGKFKNWLIFVRSWAHPILNMDYMNS